MFSDMTAAVDIDNVLRDQLDEIVHIVRESRADASLGPVVVDVLYTIDRDWSGDDAVHFTVVTRDPPGRDFYDWIELEPIAEQLHELVRQRGIARLPYVTCQLESERRALAAGDYYADKA